MNYSWKSMHEKLLHIHKVSRLHSKGESLHVRQSSMYGKGIHIHESVVLYLRHVATSLVK